MTEEEREAISSMLSDIGEAAKVTAIKYIIRDWSINDSEKLTKIKKVMK